MIRCLTDAFLILRFLAEAASSSAAAAAACADVIAVRSHVVAVALSTEAD